MTSTEIEWLIIVGSVAAWLADELSGRGPLGVVVDRLLALVGGVLAVFLLPALLWLVSFVSSFFGGSTSKLNWWPDVSGMEWWVGIPVAFLGALLIIYAYRWLFRVQKPSP